VFAPGDGQCITGREEGLKGIFYSWFFIFEFTTAS
jgi:hypothetical protein